MKEVTVKRFEKGDFIRGKKGNGYAYTNEKMTRGVVVDVDENNWTMKVKVLDHECGFPSGTFDVINDDRMFELIPKVDNKAKTSKNLMIFVSCMEGCPDVVATVRAEGTSYTAEATCAPEDEFDFLMGAAIAISRAFNAMED